MKKTVFESDSNAKILNKSSSNTVLFYTNFHTIQKKEFLGIRIYRQYNNFLY